METWYKCWCDCGKANWISFGDPLDQTGYDPEGYKCWNCGKLHSFDDEEYELENGEEVDEARFEEGLKEPT